MNQKKPIVTLLLLVALSGAAVDTANPIVDLEPLRQAFESADQACRELPAQPKLGTKNFHQDLTVWSELNRQRTTALNHYVDGLFDVWLHPIEDPHKRAEVEGQLLRLRAGETAKPTNYGMQQQKHFSRRARAALIQSTRSQAEVIFLTKMTVPGEHQRYTDKMATRGRASEPFGWDVQDTHSLALMRAGKFAEARAENERLLLKTSLLIRGQDRYLRQFYLQRALLEAHAGDLATAAGFLKKIPAANVDAPASPDATALLEETETLIRQKK